MKRNYNSESISAKNQLIKDFRLYHYKMDFMGYPLRNLSYHHLIIPKRLGGERTYENGAILSMDTSHEYLHKIEMTDPEIFHLITNLMIHEKEILHLDLPSLKQIHTLLEYVEIHYPQIVKEKYLCRQRII